MAATDGGSYGAFNGRNESEKANDVDLTILFDKMADHYGDSNEDITDMDISDAEALVEVFDKMADFYSFGPGKYFDDATDLWIIYDSLAELFGRASDFLLEDEEIEDMYVKMQKGQPIDRTFEGKQYNDLTELLERESKQKSEMMDELLEEMYEFEQIEEENEEDFEEKYDEMGDEIELLYEEIANSDDRFEELEELIREGQTATENS